MTAIAWVGFPLVFYVVAVGIGLLAERLARNELPDALLAPVGACLSVGIALAVLRAGGDGPAMAVALMVPALAGLLLARNRLGTRLAPGSAGGAALLVFALYMGPVVLSGHWTWLGYNFVNDTGTNLAVTEHLARFGTALEAGEPSTRLIVVNDTLRQGYPLGVHALLAALEWLVPAPVEAVYQPFIATLVAFGAMALAWLARAVGLPGAAAMVVAATALGSNLTYQYALQGSFKEIALIMVVATGSALARFVLDRQLAIGAVAILGACFAAGIGIFTAGAAGYAAVLAAVMLIAVVAERPRQRATAAGRAVLVGAAAMVLAAGPILSEAIDFARTGTEVFANTNQDFSLTLSSPTVLGHLARPLPIYQALGIWPRQDYRIPLPVGWVSTLTTVLLVLAGTLLLLAVFVELRRRRLATPLAAAPVLVVYLLAAPRLEPYADAKLLVVMAPFVVFGAAMGAWWLYSRVRVAGVVAALALVGGVVVSDALAYRNAHIVPVQRMEALRDAAEHASGRGPWLFPEWEEYAKHFGRPAAINVASESFSPRSVDLRTAAIVFNHSFDLDEMTLEYVQSWPGIMLRRSPENSRPPSNFTRTYRNDYYELWEKRPEAPRVIEHLSLQRPRRPAVPARCQDVRDLASRAQPGERLVAVKRGALPLLGATFPPPYGATQPDLAPLWAISPEEPGTLITNGSGLLAGRLTVGAGTYDVWIKGGGGRPLHVSVDGRETGAPRQLNTPGQWLPAGRVRLEAGEHEIALRRPGAGLEPGNGINGPVGGVALEPVREPDPISVPPSHADRLCGRPYDWIERVASSAGS
jgi:hypothetical protein